MAASMDDLIATISGVQAGKKGNDIQDLHAKLKQTLQPTIPTYRPIAPTQPHGSAHNTGPLPPPAPASSWNSPPPPTANYLHASSPSFASFGNNASPRQAAFVGKRETGFNAVPAPKNALESQQQGIPYHAEVLPIRASPKDTGGFANDAFAPLWNGENKERKGFAAR